MKKLSLSIAALAFAATPALGQTFDNGGMAPLSGGCNGGMHSDIEAPSNVFGNNTIVTSFHQADDFNVPGDIPEGATLSSLKWYLYQSFAPTNEPITAVYIELWRGSQADMLAGTATLVGGDMTTNRLQSWSFTNIYRTTVSTPTNCDRAIKEVVVDMSWAPALTAGTYWIAVGSTGNPSYSGPWANHVVPRDGTENSIFRTVATGVWAVNYSADGITQWDYPFKLDYSGGGGGYTVAVTGSCPGTVRLAWSGADPNRQQGILFARNTGNFTINSGPCAGTQLGLGTNQLQLYNTIGTGSGSGAVNAQAGQGACRGYVQLIQTNNCRTSNVAQVP